MRAQTVGVRGQRVAHRIAVQNRVGAALRNVQQLVLLGVLAVLLDQVDKRRVERSQRVGRRIDPLVLGGKQRRLQPRERNGAFVLVRHELVQLLPCRLTNNGLGDQGPQPQFTVALVVELPQS